MNRVKQMFSGPAIARSFSLPQRLSEAVTRRAIQEQRPVSWVVQRALVMYLGEGGLVPASDQIRSEEREV